MRTPREKKAAQPCPGAFPFSRRPSTRTNAASTKKNPAACATGSRACHAGMKAQGYAETTPMLHQESLGPDVEETRIKPPLRPSAFPCNLQGSMLQTTWESLNTHRYLLKACKGKNRKRFENDQERILTTTPIGDLNQTLRSRKALCRADISLPRAHGKLRIQSRGGIPYDRSPTLRWVHNKIRPAIGHR